MDHSHQTERDFVSNPSNRWELASFADVLAEGDQLGTNSQVIDLYRTWIALHGARGRHAHAAWFNLGAEWGHAGEPDNVILAYRAALALRHDFTPAAINPGLLPEHHGEPQSALACWAFTYHYEESLIQVECALRSQNAPVAEPVADVIPDQVLAGTAAL